MTTPEFPDEAAVGTPANLAQWGTRAAGWVIDVLPLIILSVITFWSDTLRLLVGAIGIAYFYIYLGFLDGVVGQTPGKAVMGTRLVDTSGKVIGSGPGIARKFAHIIDSLVCFLGWLLPIVDTNRQTIADKIMTTYVVEGSEKKPFSVELFMPPKA